MDLIVDSRDGAERQLLLALSHWRCYHYCQHTIKPTSTPPSQLWRVSVWSFTLSLWVFCVYISQDGWVYWRVWCGKCVQTWQPRELCSIFLRSYRSIINTTNSNTATIQPTSSAAAHSLNGPSRNQGMTPSFYLIPPISKLTFAHSKIRQPTRNQE